MPEKDEWHNWFSEAYGVLVNSRTESGNIPLSELKLYADNFGLIGTFSEFVGIIYAINDLNNAELDRRRENTINANKIK